MLYSEVLSFVGVADNQQLERLCAKTAGADLYAEDLCLSLPIGVSQQQQAEECCQSAQSFLNTRKRPGEYIFTVNTSMQGTFAQKQAHTEGECLWI